MKILHYGLGYPPSRTGGLTKYVLDLMTEQWCQGEDIYYLYPGRNNFLKKDAYIKMTNKHQDNSIKSYEIINSLPLPLKGGISNPKKFMEPANEEIYINLLEEIEPDVIHVHTLMGIHKEFFKIAKEKSIHIIYTTHDYFGLSPNPTFFFKGKSWDEDNSDEFWAAVGIGASMSVSKLKLFQLSFYPQIRKFFKKLSHKKKSKIHWKDSHVTSEINESTRKKFTYVRKFYQELFSYVNIFHFNSEISKEVYEKNLVSKPVGKVIPISNSSIKGGRKKINKKELKNIAFIGSYTKEKGCFDFINLAKQDVNSVYNYYMLGDDLDISIPKNVYNYGRFDNSEREKIFSIIDLVIIPSIWKETFGFLVPEALSYSVPVMASEKVGAKILLDSSLIYSHELTLDKIPKSVSCIVQLTDIKEHAKDIINYYQLRSED